ncbi:DUF3558 domain-containing protein [Solihabitans fulvus]|uniref:DUF3558 domain-containing protein n=1 Tax=Solihabitans fulvus TaxID=1892852 RepID=A0A5B2WTI5_9PSEU|nr:DUF3558 family protein [Solihabitans fulvus]KAA2254895.1 DUF3558 domain-containing protein [Solihabitans fulvus]
MHIRRLGAALAIAALPLSLTACAQQVGGSPVAAPGAPPPSGSERSSTDAPSESNQPSSSDSPSTSASAAPGTGSPAAPGTVSKAKKADGVKVCELFTADDVAAIVGGAPDTPPSGDGCVLSFSKPTAVLSVMSTVTDKAAAGDPIQIGGNSATQQNSGSGCDIHVLLSTDPKVIAGTLEVNFIPIGANVDACGISQKIATLVFDKLPPG